MIEKLSWTTQQHPIKSLIPCDFNPRTISEDSLDKLKNSLDKFNLVEIPVIDLDFTLVAGHQRVCALFILGRGDELIDVRVPNRKLTEEEFKEYMLLSNINNGEFDWSKIEEFFQEIDLKAVGMPIDDYDKYLEALSQTADEIEADFEPELPEEPITKLGDLYELISSQKKIKHVVLCGDATQPESYQKILQNEQFNLVVTDPPYNVNYEGGTKDKLKIKNDDMSDSDFATFLYMFYQECFNRSAFGAPIYVFHADTEGVNFRQQLKQSGYKLSQCLIWAKNGMVLGRNDYHWQHEPILYGWKEGEAHPWYSDRKQTTILNFDKPMRNTEHPTMKPLDIVMYLIKNSSKQADIVGDSFLGSGSTLIACENTWRQCRGLELDPRFVDVIVKRWLKYCQENGIDFEIKKNGKLLKKAEINLFTT